MYKHLLRNCLALDIRSQREELKNEELTRVQTDESIATLGILGREWAVGEAFRTISLLELFFQKYKFNKIPYNAMMNALESIHSMRKNSGWLGSNEVF